MGLIYLEVVIDADLQIWQAMEELVHDGKAKLLGISNVTLQQIEELYKKASIKPSFIQNRCFAITHWDKEVRLFCKAAQHDLPGVLFTYCQSALPFKQEYTINGFNI